MSVYSFPPFLFAKHIGHHGALLYPIFIMFFLPGSTSKLKPVTVSIRAYQWSTQTKPNPTKPNHSKPNTTKMPRTFMCFSRRCRTTISFYADTLLGSSCPIVGPAGAKVGKVLRIPNSRYFQIINYFAHRFFSSQEILFS